jgi:uncharacterized protein YegL
MAATLDKPSYALVGNPVQRTPCMLVLDASDSMNQRTSKGTRRIDELNAGLKTLEAELHADPTATVRVQLAIVSVGGPLNSADLILDWTDAKDFQAFPLTASNTTPLAKALLTALDRIEAQKAAYRQHGINCTRPWLMVITDGEPTDSDGEWEDAVRACRSAENNRKCVIYPIGVADANRSKLQEISSTQVLMLDQVRFVELFQWLSSSLQTVSRSVAGAETVQLPSTNPWMAVKT